MSSTSGSSSDWRSANRLRTRSAAEITVPRMMSESQTSADGGSINLLLTELAESLGVARSTCSESLHRAEGAIVKQFLANAEPEASIE